MIIRCASNMLIANNTIDDIDCWVFDIQQNGNYSGSLTGLKIQNNVITQHGAKIYAFQVALPAGSIVDRDDVYVTGGAPIASVVNKGNAYDLATLRSWTGTDQHSVSVDPQFTNAGGRDYHLRSSSAGHRPRLADLRRDRRVPRLRARSRPLRGPLARHRTHDRSETGVRRPGPRPGSSAFSVAADAGERGGASRRLRRRRTSRSAPTRRLPSVLGQEPAEAGAGDPERPTQQRSRRRP